MTTYHYVVKGRVQGVSFRYYTIREAEKHRISGTVKNLANGDVEVYAQGEADDIGRFEAFLNQGPFMARVEKVEKEILDQSQIYHSFDAIF